MYDANMQTLKPGDPACLRKPIDTHGRRQRSRCLREFFRSFPLQLFSVTMAGSEFLPRETNDKIIALEFDRRSDSLEPTAHDVREMDLFGIEPTFKRRFKFVAMVGFASTVVMCWQNTLATFSFALANGGTGGYFFTYIYGMFAFGFTYLSLAELSSSYLSQLVRTPALPLTIGAADTPRLVANTSGSPNVRPTSSAFPSATALAGSAAWPGWDTWLVAVSSSAISSTTVS